MQILKVKRDLMIFLLGLGIHFLSSCHQKVDWLPPDFEPKPTVSSVIKSGEPISVKVSVAVGIKAQAHPEVDNAQVLLYIDNEYLETLEYIGEGYYQSDHEALNERVYRCEVTIPGYQTAICSTYIPKKQNIILFEHINKAGVNEEGLTYPAVKVTFENNHNQAVYYELVINLIENEYTSRANLLSIVDPILLNEGLPIMVFSNELIKGNTYTMVINYTTGSSFSSSESGLVTELFPVFVELRTICYHYYRFIKQQYLYELATGDPIFSVGATSTYNLYSNVENGYGIFAGYSSVKSEIIYP